MSRSHTRRIKRYERTFAVFNPPEDISQKFWEVNKERIPLIVILLFCVIAAVCIYFRLSDTGLRSQIFTVSIVAETVIVAALRALFNRWNQGKIYRGDLQDSIAEAVRPIIWVIGIICSSLLLPPKVPSLLGVTLTVVMILGLIFYHAFLAILLEAF